MPGQHRPETTLYRLWLCRHPAGYAAHSSRMERWKKSVTGLTRKLITERSSVRMWASTGIPGVNARAPAARLAFGASPVAVAALTSPGPSGPSTESSTSYQARPVASSRTASGEMRATWPANSGVSRAGKAENRSTAS